MTITQNLPRHQHAPLGLRAGSQAWLRRLKTTQPTLRRPGHGHSASHEPGTARPDASMRDRGFPKVELLRTPSALLLRAALPGVQEKDLRVRVEESDLVLEGELYPDPEDAGREPMVREWAYGPFHRRIQLGVTVAAAAVKAALRDGMLRIAIQLPTSDHAPSASPVC